MSKGFRRFVIMLTAISVMLTMTVSPVMGEQYSDTLNVSVRYNEDAMWEGTEAEIITEAVDESDEAEAESPTPEACDNEKPIQEAGSEEQPEPGDRVWEPLCEG